ncbi:MAG: YfbK domain-containing protein [Thermoguttaceae bacterium]
MKIDHNDPKWTAFVLGEVTETEKNAIEKEIETNPDLRSEIEEIRKIVTEIESTMKAEPLPAGSASFGGAVGGNTGGERANIRKDVDQPTATKPKRRYFSLTSLLIIIVAMGLFASFLMVPGKEARELARHAQQKANETEKMWTKHDVAPAKSLQVDMNAEQPTISLDEKHELLAELNTKADAEPDLGKNQQKQKEQPSQPEQPRRMASADSPYENAETLAKDLDAAADSIANSQTLPTEAKTNESNKGLPASPPTQKASRGRIDGAFRGEMGEMGGMGGMGGNGGGEMVMRRGYSAPSQFGVRGTMGTVDEGKSAAVKGGAIYVDGRPAYDSSIIMGSQPQVAIVQEDREEPDWKRDPFNNEKTEKYKNAPENEFLKPKDAPFSTFSIDVDTASYSTMRRFLESGQKPPQDAVRLEEFVNYFKYDYAPPSKDDVAAGKNFATHLDVASCPWEPEHLLVRVGIKGKTFDTEERPPLNLVFLIDVSGSMSASNRLPLVIRSLTELVEMLQPKDRVAIVTYAGRSELILPSVSGQEKQAILDSIGALQSGGGTAGAAGIKTAYEVARKYFRQEGQNRVILCTDGDFNVGTTDNKTLEDMIGEEAKSGVFLTVLGFGMGNIKDERLKTLSMRGNGNYGYIDTIDEARKLLVEGLTGTLFTIAKDVKIQVDFNPNRVAAYRLLGYETRKLKDEDFHNDKVDAGEIGAGHTVTALYEIVPVGVKIPGRVDASRYSVESTSELGKSESESKSKSETESETETEKTSDMKSAELLLVKLRYKQPDGVKSSYIDFPLVFEKDSKIDFDGDSQFSAAVALFGMLLKNSQHSGSGNYDMVLELANPNLKEDKYRIEFVDLVKKAKDARD